MDIYKVSFGMVCDVANNPVYRDVLFVEKEGSVMEFNVYGTFVGETFRELVTGEEIPIPRRKSIPGFGAYQLNKVYLVEDYQILIFYLNLANKFPDEYKISFDAYRDYLNKIGTNYVTNYMDSYGKLSNYSEEREKALDNELNSCVRKVEELVDDLRVKEMSWVKHQDNLQLCLFKDEK